ncbi:MAG: hypothetical protein ACE5OZ_00925 [Candidatus Heimdallarchaeota archaeon]
MQNQIFCSLCKSKEPSEIYLCPDCGISLCEMCLGPISTPTCICGSSRLREVGELSAYALQGIFDLQRVLENAVFVPLRQYKQWAYTKEQLTAYSPIFEVQIPEGNRSLNHITSTMRFVLNNLNDYSTRLRKLFIDVTATSRFSPEDFQRFQEDLEFTNQDISFFCERIEDKALRATPLLEKMQGFVELLSRQQELLGNVHNDHILNPQEKIRWVSDVGRCEINGRTHSAHVVVTSARFMIISHYERSLILEISPDNLEGIVIRRSLLGRKKCLIRTKQIEIKFLKTSTDLQTLKRQLETGSYNRTDEAGGKPQDFFDPSWFADRYHEKIRALLKLAPGDTGRWKALLIDALRKVSTYVKTRTHDLRVIKRTYQRTLHELVKAENSAHLAGYENRLQEIDEELAELEYLQDILSNAFSQIDTEFFQLDETEKDDWLPNEPVSRQVADDYPEPH